MDDLYNEFKLIANSINSIDIIPALYGSLGLSKILNINLNPQDIDILIPLKYLKDEWEFFKENIEKLGYTLKDLREHEFSKGNIKIAFSDEEDLFLFADVDYNKLEIIEDVVKYKKLSLQDYLKVYLKSSKDSYRKDKNNNKDKFKIDIIKKYLN